LGQFVSREIRSFSNTNVAQTLIPNSITGTTTIISSTDSNNPQLITGKNFRYNFKGTIQTHNPAGNLTIIITLGAITLFSQTFTLLNSIGPTYFELDGNFTVRGDGVSGLVINTGKIITGTGIVSGATVINLNGTEQSIDTTINRAFNVTLTFNTANLNNAVNIQTGIMTFDN
jgi:hypothetical protein